MRPQAKTALLDNMIFLLVFLSLLALWSVVIVFSGYERELTLERAREQLAVSVYTLADFSELSSRLAVLSPDGTDARAEALWRAFLQYPAASIWVEDSEGEITAGFPLADLNSELNIVVKEQRSDFTVYAALPVEEALTFWYSIRKQRIITLIIASGIFLLLTHFLVRSLHQRAGAERKAATVLERNKQLQIYREQLELTVAERTNELASANTSLGEELSERKVAEQTLREHDALLSSVAKGASKLLSTHNVEDAINAVLEMIGQTIVVSRAQLQAITQEKDGHFYASPAFEWCAPGLNNLLNNPRYQHIDISNELPREVSSLFSQKLVTFHLTDILEPYRAKYQQAEMLSFLYIPIVVEDKLWGVLCFTDSRNNKRVWSWAETDTLLTLGGLIGVALTRARFMKELADANAIVQNSPTILYRLKGEPSFPLIYISHNITKFGHDSAELLNNQNWINYLVSPDDHDTLMEAMHKMLSTNETGASLEFRLLTGDGDFRWVENRYTSIRDDKGRLVEVEGIIIDITERKAAEEKISAMARTDALTSLANRATFNERLGLAFAAAKRGGGQFAVFYMDIDHFKTINDTLGHAIGDQLLLETAKRLNRATRETDLVARLGGDEFAVLQTDITDIGNAGTLAKNIQTAISRSLVLESNDIHVTCSIGICPWSPDMQDADNMLTQADLALYRAKEDGRNCFRFHSSELDQEVLERSIMAEELREGIEKGQMELAWQPQIAINNNSIVGIEALVRWNHPRKGLMTALDFISVAEKTGTIMALGRWVLDTACRQLHLWRAEGLKLDVITLNLSAIQLKNSNDLLADISRSLDKWGLKPNDLEFDVTEAMLAQTIWTQNNVFSKLRELGCKIAIANFGTEYSSIDYLRSYAVNHLKIAKSFIQDAIKSPETANTIRAIIQLANDLDVGVIVEGVETAAENELLQSLNKAANAQGCFYSKAVSGSVAGVMLKSGNLGPEWMASHKNDKSAQPERSLLTKESLKNTS